MYPRASSIIGGTGIRRRWKSMMVGGVFGTAGLVKAFHWIYLVFDSPISRAICRQVA